MAREAGYVIGDGGHGRTIARLTGAKLLGIGDAVPNKCVLYVGFGDARKRQEIFLSHLMWSMPPIIYGTNYGFLGDASQLMPGSVAMPGADIMQNVLINTGATVDHDCVIHNHCVLSPGAVLCGNVTLGEGCMIGAGAIIVQGVKLDAWTKIPAGTLVVGPNDFRRPTPMVHHDGKASVDDCQMALEGLDELNRLG